jgi:hypothetical protein
LNPNDWYDTRLTKDAFGRYILGDPQSMVRPNIFGLSAVATTSIASGTFLVGSGDPVASEIRDRMEMQVQISTSHSDYFAQAQNISTIKASYRGRMNQVYTLPVNSANLQTPKSLESAFLSGQIGQIGTFGQSYTSTYGVQPTSGAAPNSICR